MATMTLNTIKQVLRRMVDSRRYDSVLKKVRIGILEHLMYRNIIVYLARIRQHSCADVNICDVFRWIYCQPVQVKWCVRCG